MGLLLFVARSLIAVAGNKEQLPWDGVSVGGLQILYLLWRLDLLAGGHDHHAAVEQYGCDDYEREEWVHKDVDGDAADGAAEGEIIQAF